MPIDATPGGPDSNSYGTEDEANTYFNDRIGGRDWAALDDKEMALITATSWLELRNYVGAKTTSTQALKWPRAWVADEDGVMLDDDVIPSRVKRASFELAKWLLENPDSLTSTGLAGFKMIQIDQGASFEMIAPGTSDPMGSLPTMVMRLIAPFLLGDQARVLRA